MNSNCRHANGHFEEVEGDEVDKQLARDLEVAQQLSLAPSSPPSAMVATLLLSAYYFFRNCFRSLKCFLTIKRAYDGKIKTIDS